ncbi:hypothetical protein Emag_001435 [Eimeria magna]
MSFVSQPVRPHVAEPLVDEREALVASGSRGYDAIVRSNIQTIRGNLQSIEANEQQQATASSHEALEKQRDKFLFEKLFAHFQAEIKRVQELSERVRDAAERAAEPGTFVGGVEGVVNDEQQTSQFQNSGVILDMENAGAYGDAGDPDSLFITEDPREIAEFDLVTENDALLSRAVAEERFQGIRRIHAQVSQARIPLNTEPLRVAVVRGGPAREAASLSSEEAVPPALPADAIDETPAIAASNEEVIFAPPTPPPAVAVQSARELMKGGFKPQLPAP